MKALPINDGEVYVRCPGCGLLGWTIDDDSIPPPTCPDCEVEGVIVGDLNEVESGRWSISVIDGPPADPAHHLGRA